MHANGNKAVKTVGKGEMRNACKQRKGELKVSNEDRWWNRQNAIVRGDGYSTELQVNIKKSAAGSAKLQLESIWNDVSSSTRRIK